MEENSPTLIKMDILKPYMFDVCSMTNETKAKRRKRRRAVDAIN